MNISFDNPLWWLMTAALVPLLVHLVARTRPRERFFSSVVLLRELVRLQQRRTRPRDWLLLLLRTLLCASLALAFTLPILGGGSGGEGGRALLIVLDNTASMGASDGQQVRMNTALEVAGKAVQGLAPGDRANLITLAGYPDFLFDKPESARPLLMRELGKVRTEDATSADVIAALKSARSQLRELPEHVRGQVLLISDFQTSAMQQVLNEVQFGADELCCVTVAQSHAIENTSIASLALSPSKPLPGQKITLTVTLQHRNGTIARESPLPLTVTISADNLRHSQPCEIPPGGTCSVQFELTAPSSGGDWLLTATTEEDRFPADNIRHLVVPVAERLDCLAISPDRVQLGFMIRALENIPALRVLHLPSLPETSADYVVWSAPTVADVENIRERLAGGATVLVVPDFAGDTALTPLLNEQEGKIAGEICDDDEGWKTKLIATDDNSFSLFETQSLSEWTQQEVYCRLDANLRGILPASADILVSYADEQEKVPALVRVPMGRGCLLIWNMPVTTHYSRQGYSPLYLPVLAEQLLHARGTSEHPEPVAGQDYLQLTIPTGMSAEDICLRRGDGQPVPVEVTPHSIRSEAPVLPGVYRWFCGDELLHIEAVNFPAEESELSSFQPEIEGVLMSADEAVEGAELSVSQPLWPWLLAAAFIFFMLELILCRPSKKAQQTSES